jgi:hypothetical protein
MTDKQENSIVLAIVVVMALVVMLMADAPDVVAIPNYSHAVAVCDDEVQPLYVHADFSTWADGVATYTVNAGHEYDPEVVELETVAHELCPGNKND